MNHDQVRTHTLLCFRKFHTCFNIACVGAGQCDHMPFTTRSVGPMLQIGFTYLKDAEPQGCYKLHLINNFRRVTDTHFLDLRRTQG